jgi:hypothetical protein
MGGACNFIFSKSVLGLVAISASACLHERKQNLAIRSHAYDRHTPAFLICPAPEPEGAEAH